MLGTYSFGSKMCHDEKVLQISILQNINNEFDYKRIIDQINEHKITTSVICYKVIESNLNQSDNRTVYDRLHLNFSFHLH